MCEDVVAWDNKGGATLTLFKAVAASPAVATAATLAAADTRQRAL